MIEFIDYVIAADKAQNCLGTINLSLSNGNVCAIRSDSPGSTHTFLRALATLLSPDSGTYRFMDETLDFSDYRELLPFKRRIGYIGSGAAMISNLTIEDNLMLMRQYSENSLDIPVEGIMLDLIRLFGLEQALAMRPGELTPPTLRLAIVVRELAKSPDLLLVEYPEDYIGKANLTAFKQTLAGMSLSQRIIIMVSEDEDLIDEFANTTLSISEGVLTKVQAEL